MHYPGHLRDNFASWVEDGFPEVASVEYDYEDHLQPRDELLRRMLDCSDYLPSALVDDIEDALLGDRLREGTYGEAARLLLANPPTPKTGVR